VRRERTSFQTMLQICQSFHLTGGETVYLLVNSYKNMFIKIYKKLIANDNKNANPTTTKKAAKFFLFKNSN
jgi:hypothetical protein